MQTSISIGNNWSGAGRRFLVDLPAAPQIGQRVQINAVPDVAGTVIDVVWQFKTSFSGHTEFMDVQVLVRP